MPIHIVVYPDHIVVVYLDENERFLSFRYETWQDIFADFTCFVSFDIVKVQVR